ncbi:hypothetical protein [Streptomyces phaeofaciens]|nr:hypothetical protein [Streptomyces phaeofaciens]
MAEGQAVRAFGPDGKAGGFADAEAKLAHEGVYYLDGALSGAAIAPGFSGGPLWCPHDPAVVGLVVAHRETHGPLTSRQAVRRIGRAVGGVLAVQLLVAALFVAVGVLAHL